MYPQAIRRLHYDIITWNCFSYYWNIVPGFHRSTTCTKKLPQLTKRLTGLSPVPRLNHLDANTFQLCGKTVRHIAFKFHIIKICAQNKLWPKRRNFILSRNKHRILIQSLQNLVSIFPVGMLLIWFNFVWIFCLLVIYLSKLSGVQHDIGRIQVSLGPITMRLKRSASI